MERGLRAAWGTGFRSFRAVGRRLYCTEGEAPEPAEKRREKRYRKQTWEKSELARAMHFDRFVELLRRSRATRDKAVRKAITDTFLKLNAKNLVAASIEMAKAGVAPKAAEVHHIAAKILRDKAPLDQDLETLAILMERKMFSIPLMLRLIKSSVKVDRPSTTSLAAVLKLRLPRWACMVGASHFVDPNLSTEEALATLHDNGYRGNLALHVMMEHYLKAGRFDRLIEVYQKLPFATADSLAVLIESCAEQAEMDGGVNAEEFLSLGRRAYQQGEPLGDESGRLGKAYASLLEKCGAENDENDSPPATASAA